MNGTATMPYAFPDNAKFNLRGVPQLEGWRNSDLEIFERAIEAGLVSLECRLRKVVEQNIILEPQVQPEQRGNGTA